jgi:S1-C subfamily serine protease
VADVIVKIKGTPINSIGDMEIIETLKIGDRIPFVVLREGKEQTIYVTIGERPQGI